MALVDQPYIPLYVDDWMNNNKLKMCSPGSHGVLVSIMCIMHKSNSGYGKILLQQKFKQSSKQVLNFATQLAKLCAFDVADIELYLEELIEAQILIIANDYLMNKRMVKDGAISTVRSGSGSSGGKKTAKKRAFEAAVAEQFAKDFAVANVQAKPQAKVAANTVIENVSVNGSDSACGDVPGGGGLNNKFNEVKVNSREGEKKEPQARTPAESLMEILKTPLEDLDLSEYVPGKYDT